MTFFGLLKIMTIFSLSIFKILPSYLTSSWLFTRYAGSRIKIDGGELRIINDDEVLAVVDDPRDILPANIL